LPLREHEPLKETDGSELSPLELKTGVPVADALFEFFDLSTQVEIVDPFATLKSEASSQSWHPENKVGAVSKGVKARFVIPHFKERYASIDFLWVAFSADAYIKISHKGPL